MKRLFVKLCVLFVCFVSMTQVNLYYTSTIQPENQTELALKQFGTKSPEAVSEVRQGMLLYNMELVNYFGMGVFGVLLFLLFYSEFKRLKFLEKE